MYTFIADQAPSGPTGLKVNPLLFKIYMNIHWTWLLPHHGTLCIIRYEGNHHQAARKLPKDKEKDPKTQELTGSVKMKKRKCAEIALPDSPVPTADSPVARKMHYRTVRSTLRTVQWHTKMHLSSPDCPVLTTGLSGRPSIATNWAKKPMTSEAHTPSPLDYIFRAPLSF